LISCKRVVFSPLWEMANAIVVVDMKLNPSAPLLGASVLALAAMLAACGGGGGGGSTTPPTGGGNPPVTGSSPTPPGATPTPPGATPTPPGATPSPSPGVTGVVDINGAPLANATVLFTCGCSGEAGEVSATANGNYTLTFPATAIPASPTPYTPPGHNLMIVGYGNGSTAQAWTMEFLGSTPANNLNLSSTPSNATANATDTASTAAALYVYYEAAESPQIPGTDRTFDWFNFNQIAAFAQHLRTSPTPDEQTFMNDVSAQQAAGGSLYPGFVPDWNPNPNDGTDATITNDIRTVANDGLSADATLPTPCPSANGSPSCTGAPTP
jgi:hypothetical protein